MKALIFLLFSINAYAIHPLVEIAKKQGWVYNEAHPDYATGYKFDPTYKHTFTYESLKHVDIEIPDEYDLTDKLSPIRNQGSCGSCWAFSITAMLRDALIIRGLKDPGALSEQYLVDCARDMYGCGGGMPEAAAWIITPKGAPLLSEYPYTARNGRCQTKPIAGSALEWHYIGQQGRIPDVSEIQKAILLYGEVSTTVAVDNAFAGYSGGVFHGNYKGINHMTDIVGWSKKGGYWRMRNSWGTGWGINGWGNIAYGANAIGTDAIFVKVVEIPPAPPVPVIREFGLESTNLHIKVTLSPDNKQKLEDAKKLIQTFLDNLDKK